MRDIILNRIMELRKLPYNWELAFSEEEFDGLIKLPNVELVAAFEKMVRIAYEAEGW